MRISPNLSATGAKTGWLRARSGWNLRPGSPYYRVMTLIGFASDDRVGGGMS